MRRAYTLFVLVLLGICTSSCRGPGKDELLRRGDALAREGKWTDALSAYRQALARDKLDGQVHARVADALARVSPGDVQQIRRERIRAAQASPADLSLQFKAGMMLVDARRWDDAGLRAEFIRKANPNTWQGRVLEGEIAAGRGDLAKARTLIDEAIAIGPDEAEAHLSLGRLHAIQKEPAEAEAAFLEAIRLNASLAPAHAELGALYVATGRTLEAERAFKEATTLNPGDASSFQALARLYQSDGRLVEAEAPLKQWVALRKQVPAARLALVDYYIRTNRLDDAQKAITAAGATGEGGNALDRRLVDITYRMNRKAEAHRQADAVLARNPGNVEWLKVKARLLLYDGKLDEALATAQQVVKLDPATEDGYFLLGTILSERGDIDRAIENFTHVTRLTPQSQAAKSAMVELWLRQGTPEAFAKATALVGKGRSGLGLALALCRGLMQRHELARADALLAGLVTDHPNSAPVHVHIGRLRVLQRRLDDARTAFDRALALNPRASDAFRGRVEVELDVNEVSLARQLVDARLESVASGPTLLLAARVYELTSATAKAEAALRRVVEMNANDDLAMMALVRLFERQNRLEQARQHYESAARQSPDDVVAATMAGLIAEAQDKRADAEQVLAAVVRRAPAAAVALASLARLYAVGPSNRLDEALDFATRARLLLPESGDLASTLGWIQYRRGHAASAIRLLESGVTALPNSAAIRYRLGMAYVLAGQPARALASFDQALRLRPDHPQAVAAKATLRSGIVPASQRQRRSQTR